MSRLTYEELFAMFPDGIPLALMKVMFPEGSSPLTTDELRELCAAIARPPVGRDPIGYRSQMELMHRMAQEIRQHGMSTRAEELRSLLQGLEREFPEAEAVIGERWGTGRTALKNKEGR